ncbi:class I SAM-dependent methyltransferase [Microbulbifer yueqingensis]|uniref:Methyltransferase domain-containing protein n=1 Tax=Microbulbifer yueqingensis TaxID=658219 RepID=A0A1G9AH65_9GAMM|nr:class I SAM-dependent methyltransferase [Microbulbifer yueqingensis]SDK26618.1 Methyltransferase domain-containing protein [Microbulbifer yueqingensis]
MSPSCPLCGHPAAQPYHRDNFRSYHQCAVCALVFVPEQFQLSATDERAYYDLHENSLEDAGYRRFLARCAAPLVEALPPASRGLDFGCGPAPLLASMLSEAGHRVELYDAFYAPDRCVLKGEFDFIVATEVVEHLSRPGEVLGLLWSRLREGGILALMTKLVISPERFAQWHYIRDPTHICFFSRETLRWLAARLGAGIEFVDSDVIFLRK